MVRFLSPHRLQHTDEWSCAIRMLRTTQCTNPYLAWWWITWKAAPNKREDTRVLITELMLGFVWASRISVHTMLLVSCAVCVRVLPEQLQKKLEKNCGSFRGGG
jgi:hypothetical protein